MKCRCQTYHHRVRACPNEGHVDGYCYLHHPEVLLAKLRYQRRAGHGLVPSRELDTQIREQEALLAQINGSNR